VCQVFYGIPFKPGDVILTSVAEYGSNYLAFLQVMLQVYAASVCTAFELPEIYSQCRAEYVPVGSRQSLVLHPCNLLSGWCLVPGASRVFAVCCWLLQVQKRSGVVIQVIPETPEGDISIPDLQQLLAQQVRDSTVSLLRACGNRLLPCVSQWVTNCCSHSCLWRLLQLTDPHPLSVACVCCVAATPCASSHQPRAHQQRPHV
jgi:hypothetical protein